MAACDSSSFAPPDLERLRFLVEEIVTLLTAPLPQCEAKDYLLRPYPEFVGPMPSAVALSISEGEIKQINRRHAELCQEATDITRFLPRTTEVTTLEDTITSSHPWNDVGRGATLLRMAMGGVLRALAPMNASTHGPPPKPTLKITSKTTKKRGHTYHVVIVNNDEDGAEMPEGQVKALEAIRTGKKADPDAANDLRNWLRKHGLPRDVDAIDVVLSKAVKAENSRSRR